MKKNQITNLYLIFILPVLLLSYGCGDKDTFAEATEAKEEARWKDRLDNFTDWGIYRGDKLGNQYSELSQINTENVHLIEPVWEYQTRELVRPGMQSNPLIIDGLMYFADPSMNLVALDAATGKEAWLFDPREYYDSTITKGQLLKAQTYWEDANGNNKRIFHYVRDIVFAVDPQSGDIIESFGENGMLDLKNNHVWSVEDLEGQIQVTSPGITYGNYLIIGSKVGEGNVSAPGDIRAFDTMTGEFKWVFNTVPLEGQFGYDTWEWEEGMIYGGANPWGGFTVDEERGWVFAANGSGAGMFISGASRKGDNLFANCVLALDATTGKRIWHYQVIRHDIWDYDIPPPPMLATIKQENGELRDVVVQTGKLPVMFVLDRETGEPVFPVIDMPVSTKAVPGEQASPTQPWPLKPPPLVRTQMFESDISRITPESYEFVLKEYKQYESGPVYTPASVHGTVLMPGHHGSGSWGGGSYDPESNIFYVNVNEEPFVFQLRPIPPDGSEELTALQQGHQIFNANCAACHGADREGNPPAIPSLIDIKLTAEEIFKVVTEGKGYMPPFTVGEGRRNFFKAENMENLITFLQSEGDGGFLSEETIPIPDQEGVANAQPTWSGSSRGRTWTTTTPQYVNSTRHFVDHLGLPAIQPPWGKIVAVDLDKGNILWEVPLGTYPVLAEMGITNTGCENYGGMAVTAGDLIFVAATVDSKFRAFDSRNGDLLWEFQMDAPGYSAPSIYEMNGKQYVVMVAGGGSRRASPPISAGIGRTVHAFALPN